jgi:hypothetical protein
MLFWSAKPPGKLRVRLLTQYVARKVSVFTFCRSNYCIVWLTDY